MKKIYLIIAIAATMLQPATAGELTFGWNLTNSTGKINDMEFMPGHDNFIFCTSFDMQVRRTETGELVQSYPFGAFDIEFTPDSTKLIILAVGGTTGRIEIRNVSDMSLIREHIIPPETDTEGLNIVESGIGFTEMVVDPIRPYIYAIRFRAGYESGNKPIFIRRIVIYNHETMEEVGILSTEEDYTIFEKMAISKDGKYLAVNSALSSHLRVWDLETRQKIREYKLCNYNDQSEGQPSCTKFSENNTDLVYFSGIFEHWGGIGVYSVQNNCILDSTFGNEENLNPYGYFTLFNDENKILSSSHGDIYILDMLSQKKEFHKSTGVGKPGAWNKLINSNLTFVGYAGKAFSMGKYNSTLSIKDYEQKDANIYPNPAGDYIEIDVGANGRSALPQNEIRVYNSIGECVMTANVETHGRASLRIDTSELPPGIYFLRCGGQCVKFVKM